VKTCQILFTKLCSMVCRGPEIFFCALNHLSVEQRSTLVHLYVELGNFKQDWDCFSFQATAQFDREISFETKRNTTAVRPQTNKNRTILRETKTTSMSTIDNTESTMKKLTRKSVQFGRVSYSDNSKDEELRTILQELEAETPCKFMERSAMCSSMPIPPPCPPKRKASVECYFLDDDDEVDEFSSNLISMNSIMESLVSMGSSSSEEEKEEDSSHSHDSARYISPSITTHKTVSPPLAPTRTRPRLSVSAAQLPSCFPARCL